MTRHAKQAKKLLESYKPAFMKLMRAKENIERYQSQILKSPALNGIPSGTDVRDISDYIAELESLIEQQREIERVEGEKMRKVHKAIEQLIGIDNGNPEGSESLKGSKIKLHNGKALIIVRTLRDVPGNIRVGVRCEGTEDAELILTSM